MHLASSSIRSTLRWTMDADNAFVIRCSKGTLAVRTDNQHDSNRDVSNHIRLTMLVKKAAIIHRQER